MSARLTAAAIVAVALAGLGGYWIGHNKTAPIVQGTPSNDKGRILYYRNPMGQADTSAVPKKDPMGMDYIPVYERDVPTTPGTVTVDTAKIQRTGVKTEPAARRALQQGLSVPGVVKFSEAQVAVSAPRFEGWIERVHVGATGVAVRAGQPLADIYSPDLLQTQREYFLAREAQSRASESSGIAALADGALQRLRNLGLSDAQVRQIANGTEPRRTITLFSPSAGVVSEKNAVVGQHLMPGDTLYRIADSAKVWIVAKVFERDLGKIQLGVAATISLPALSGTTVRGAVSFISPGLDPDTRTADIRIDVPNENGALKADMLATVRFEIPAEAEAVTIPNSAIIDSGTRQIAIVAKGNGRFEPREVTTGARTSDYTAVTTGIAEGEQVAVDAAFLIDSESNLRAAQQSFAEPAQKTGQKP